MAHRHACRKRSHATGRGAGHGRQWRAGGWRPPISRLPAAARCWRGPMHRHAPCPLPATAHADTHLVNAMLPLFKALQPLVQPLELLLQVEWGGECVGALHAVTDHGRRQRAVSGRHPSRAFGGCAGRAPSCCLSPCPASLSTTTEIHTHLKHFLANKLALQLNANRLGLLPKQQLWGGRRQVCWCIATECQGRQVSGSSVEAGDVDSGAALGTPSAAGTALSTHPYPGPLGIQVLGQTAGLPRSGHNQQPRSNPGTRHASRQGTGCWRLHEGREAAGSELDSSPCMCCAPAVAASCAAVYSLPTLPVGLPAGQLLPPPLWWTEIEYARVESAFFDVFPAPKTVAGRHAREASARDPGGLLPRSPP